MLDGLQFYKNASHSSFSGLFSAVSVRSKNFCHTASNPLHTLYFKTLFTFNRVESVMMREERPNSCISVQTFPISKVFFSQLQAIYSSTSISPRNLNMESVLECGELVIPSEAMNRIYGKTSASFVR